MTYARCSGTGTALRILGALSRDLRGVGVEPHDRGVVPRQGRGAAAPGPTTTGTPESSSRSPSRSGWIRGIEGEICPAGLQDAEDADDQFHGAFDA